MVEISGQRQVRQPRLAAGAAASDQAAIGLRRFVQVKPLTTWDQLRAQVARLDFEKARP